MRVKKLLALLFAALMMVTTLAGCAKSYYENGSSGSAVAPMAPADGIYDNGTVTPTPTDRKLIRRISMDLQTRDLEALLETINTKISALGGYVENSKINIGSGSDDARYATIIIRIPADKLDEFTDHVADISNVTATSETAEDITLSYVATESRLKALQAEETRLLTLIDKAANLTELLQLEKRLTEIRTELEQVTSQLKVYDNLVDFGTVQLDITEVKEYSPAEEPGFWERLAKGFMNSLRGVGKLTLELVIFFVCALPYLVPLAAVLWIILILTKRKKRIRAKKDKTAEQDE